MGTASLHPKALTMAPMASTWDESLAATRKKYGLRSEVRDGLLAENVMMGTWALSPKSITKLVCIDVSGPSIAWT